MEAGPMECWKSGTGTGWDLQLPSGERGTERGEGLRAWK